MGSDEGQTAADDRFAAMVTRLTPRLSGVAMLLTGDPHDGQDLLHTTWAKVYAQWARVERADDVDAYVRQILANAAIDRGRLRGRRAREVPLAPGLPEPGLDPISRSLDADRVQRLLATLSDQQRAVLILRFLLDLSEARTAELLGLRLGTVKSYTHRALAALRVTASAFELQGAQA